CCWPSLYDLLIALYSATGQTADSLEYINSIVKTACNGWFYPLVDSEVCSTYTSPTVEDGSIDMNNVHGVNCSALKEELDGGAYQCQHACSIMACGLDKAVDTSMNMTNSTDMSGDTMSAAGNVSSLLDGYGMGSLADAATLLQEASDQGWSEDELKNRLQNESSNAYGMLANPSADIEIFLELAVACGVVADLPGSKVIADILSSSPTATLTPTATDEGICYQKTFIDIVNNSWSAVTWGPAGSGNIVVTQTTTSGSWGAYSDYEDHWCTDTDANVVHLDVRWFYSCMPFSSTTAAIPSNRALLDLLFWHLRVHFDAHTALW
ncbi:hypothetical protein CYMTET_29856, partial [Cymbomonas tetramitiformis]